MADGRRPAITLIDHESSDEAVWTTIHSIEAKFDAKTDSLAVELRKLTAQIRDLATSPRPDLKESSIERTRRIGDFAFDEPHAGNAEIPHPTLDLHSPRPDRRSGLPDLLDPAPPRGLTRSARRVTMADLSPHPPSHYARGTHSPGRDDSRTRTRRTGLRPLELDCHRGYTGELR